MSSYITYYKSQRWLNPENSASTGSVVCYDGLWPIVDKPDEPLDPYSFLEISDCHNKVRLHRATPDTEEEWIGKLEQLRDDIDNFITHLKNKNKG